jgi:UDP-N-acetylmuramoyl-tripeptide--D-alanyl-D-alanine ligase
MIKDLYNIFAQSTGVSIDTRTILPGNIFFALDGQNFDGHKYIETAFSKGAVLAVISKKEYHTEKTMLVSDTQKTLQELAHYHRKKLDIPILAITGSNGKTTTKELIMAVLSVKYNISGTKGNYNNQLGVPLTLLSFDQKTEIGIIEMGANKKGDIDELCQIAAPDIGLITNIGKAHLEGFGSFQSIIDTKTELYQYINKNSNAGVIFYDETNELLKNLLPENPETIGYGTEQSFIDGYLSPNTTSTFMEFEWKHIHSKNLHHVKTNLVGNYNLSNALAAVAIGKHFQLPGTLISSAISGYNPDNKRSQLIRKTKNTIILDAYNANPVSMLQSINNFVAIKTELQKVAVLGDMFELGKYSFEEHLQIVELSAQHQNIDFIFIGPEFYAHKTEKAMFFANKQIFEDWISKTKPQNKIILLKASRGMKFEELLPHFD